VTFLNEIIGGPAVPYQPQNNPINQIVGGPAMPYDSQAPATTGNMFMNQPVKSNIIPTDLYAWSGLPKQHRESLLSNLMPQLTSSAAAFPETIKKGFGEAKGILAGLPGVIEPYMGRKMREFKDVTEGSMQGLLNKLSGRGMLSSQVASDAMANLGKGLNQSMFGQLSDMALKTKLQSELGQADLATNEALQLGTEPGLLGQLAGLGRASEQPFQPYAAFLSLIQGLM
jgi:hypothetical protein